VRSEAAVSDSVPSPEEGGPRPKPSETAPKARRGVSLGFVVVLVVGLVLVGVVGMYSGEIGAWWKLKPWTHKPVDSVITELVAAMQARNARAAEAVLDTKAIGVVEEGGALKALQAYRGSGGPGPSMPVDKLVPTEPIERGNHYYKYLPERPRAAVDVAGPDNTRLVFIVRPEGGKWMVESAAWLPADAKIGVYWQF
jgi:hypothetical protein